MISRFFSKISSNQYVTVLTAVSLLTTIPAFVANAKPITIKNDSGVTFDFVGCIRKGNDIVCQGNFSSINGERKIYMNGYGDEGRAFIADSEGGVHKVSKILFTGAAQQCKNSDSSDCNMSLVEGINYKTTFVFSNVSLPSDRIPLFQINYLDLKIRNITLGRLYEQANASDRQDVPDISNSVQGNNISTLKLYKTDGNRIILAGLNPGQKYNIQGASLDGRQIKTILAPNVCGEIIASGASQIRSLTVDKKIINLTNLPNKKYTGCKK